MTESNTIVSIQGLSHKKKQVLGGAVNNLQVVFEVTTGYYTMNCTDGEIKVPSNERSTDVLPRKEVTQMTILIKIIYAMLFGTDSLTE